MNLEQLRKIVAGLIEPPPAMLKSIGRWIDSLIASHYWAMAEVAKPKASSGEVTEEAWKDFFVGLSLIPDEIERLVDKLKPISQTGHRKPESFDLLVWPDLIVGSVGVFRWDGPDERYGIFYIPGKMNPSQFDVSKYMFTHAGKEGIPRSAVKTVANKAVDKAQRGAQQLYSDWQQRSRGEPTASDRDLVERTRLIRECQRFATKPKAYKTSVKRTFPTDLTGWRYLSQVDMGRTRAVRQQQDEAAATKRLKAAENAVRVLIAEAKRIPMGSQTEIHPIPVVPEVSLYVKVPLAQTRVYFLYEAGPDAYAGDYGSPEELAKTIDTYYVDRARRGLDAIQKRALPETESPQRAIDEHYRNFQAVVYFKPHTQRGGQWIPSKNQLEVDLRIGRPPTVEAFERCREIAHVTLVHELRHVAQTYLGYLQGVDRAGLPPLAMRQPGMTPWGLPAEQPSVPSRKRTKQIEHELRDIEYQTDIGNAIEEYKRKVRNVPAKAHGAFFDGFTGRATNIYAVNRFFASWKKSNRAKWQRAVVELYKALPHDLVDFGQLSSTIGGRGEA
jgi:hypothetical protein